MSASLPIPHSPESLIEILSRIANEQPTPRRLVDDDHVRRGDGGVWGVGDDQRLAVIPTRRKILSHVSP
jgi:hypothetical protein